MESSTPAGRTTATTTTAQRTPATPAAPSVVDEKSAKERTDKEIAERIAAPPEQPTPTQAEADAFKSGEFDDPQAGEQRREVRPGTPAAGYTTR